MTTGAGCCGTAGWSCGLRPTNTNISNIAAARGRSQGQRARSRPRISDITRARTLLKWEPKVSLEEGLSKTIDYFRQKVQ